MSYCNEARALTAAEVESIIVDTIECEAEDYQSFEWGPVSKAIEAIRSRAFENLGRPHCEGCAVCWPTHPKNPGRIKA